MMLLMKKYIIILTLLCLTIINSRSVFSASGISGPVVLADNPSINITIAQPVVGGLIGNDLKIVVLISSTFQIKSVTANVEGRETALVFSNSPDPGWRGVLSLSGLARGDKLLTVVTKDVFDNPAQVQRQFVYDQAPRLTITAPLAETVARPSLFIDARCSDDDPAGCTSLTVYTETPEQIKVILARGTSSIQGNIFLPHDGMSVSLNFSAIDSKGQKEVVTRQVFVESSRNLAEVETVSGHIMDVQPDRILFLENTDGAQILKIRDRASGQDTVVMDDPVKVLKNGYLTPKGAIFAVESPSPFSFREFELRDGTLSDLGSVDTSSVVVKGGYAIWNERTKLIRRDLVSGINVEVSNSAGNIYNDITSNGDVVYWSSDFDIYRYNGSASTQLTNNKKIPGTLIR
jgi:hypothetical protein